MIKNLFPTPPCFSMPQHLDTHKPFFISVITHNNSEHINNMTTPNPKNNTNLPTTPPPFIAPPRCNPQQHIPPVMQTQETSEPLDTSYETNQSLEFDSFISCHEPELVHQMPQCPEYITNVPSVPVVYCPEVAKICGTTVLAEQSAKGRSNALQVKP